MFLLEKQRHYKNIFKNTSYSTSPQWEIHLRYFCSLADCSEISTRLHQRKIQHSSTEISSIIPYLMHITETESVSRLVLIIYSFLSKIAIGLWNFSSSRYTDEYNLINLMKKNQFLFSYANTKNLSFHQLSISSEACLCSKSPMALFSKTINSLRETLKSQSSLS